VARIHHRERGCTAADARTPPSPQWASAWGWRAGA